MKNFDGLKTIFSFYLNFIKEQDIKGACHDSSIFLYVTLSEYGFNPHLCIGVVRSPTGIMFDHSWVEVKGEIYDIAIGLPAPEGQYVSPPIFASKNIDNNQITDLQFGIMENLDEDIAAKILPLTIGEYLDMLSIEEQVYNIILECNRSIAPPNRKLLTMDQLKNEYSSHKRLLKRDIPF